MENKFEKQIHQKLDELEIPPSESVWLGVKDRIKYKKDRKWPVIILIFLILIIPVGYYLFSPTTERLVTSTQPPKTSTAESNSNVNNTTGKNEETARSHPDQVSDYTSDSKQGDKEKIDIPIRSSSSIDGKSSDVPNSSNNNRERKVASIKSKDYSINAANGRDQFKEKLVVTPKPDSEENFQGKDVTREGYGEPDELNAEIESQTYLHEIPDIKIDQALLLNYSSINQIKQLTLSDKAITEILKARVVVENHIKKKLSVGIYAAGGITHAGSRFLGLGPAPGADLQTSYNNSSPGGGSATASPSKVRNAFGYAAGMFLEKEISKNSSISFGINFKELNTSNFVGRKNDSIPGSISFDSRTSGVSQQYRNSFRFIEFPLQFHTQLAKANKITLLWNGGITVSQLLGSNALQFNPFPGFYYDDNSVFNKTQFGINTALSASVIRNKNLAILTGLFINYHLSKIANEGLYARRHFVFAGLQTRILFEKK